MSLIRAATFAGERIAWPDAFTRAAIGALVARTARRLAQGAPDEERRFVEAMDAYPIAIGTDAANQQHYEIPADFFALILGPRQKYSCCLYEAEATTLAEAEERALEVTAEHAGLSDGQRILELGCGWGSLSLWMAERLPSAAILAVSNSHSQKAFIEAEARRRGLGNLQVVVADMNGFAPEERFDRIVSVEMFEHMSNWRLLLARIRHWIEPDGRLFLHVFSHRSAPYRFSTDDREDWIAQHFFTGGIMPSHSLIEHLSDDFSLEEGWLWNGDHYRRTAEDWLARYDANARAIRGVLEQVYGRDAALWHRRWRLFFLATAGLFGHAGGETWGVSHYRLRPASPG